MFESRSNGKSTHSRGRRSFYYYQSLKRLSIFQTGSSSSNNGISENADKSTTVSVSVTFSDGNSTFVTLKAPHDDVSTLECEIHAHLGLSTQDVRHFSIGYYSSEDEYTLRWLCQQKGLRKQLKNCYQRDDSGYPLLHFRVKFWPQNFQPLSDQGRFLICEELKKLIFQRDSGCQYSRLFHASENLRVLLASYLLQAELGDFDPKKGDLNSIAGVSWIHTAGLDESLPRLATLHTAQRGLRPSECEHRFLQLCARHVSNYGVQFHAATDVNNTPILIGISPQGISVYRGEARMNAFAWARIRKISFKRKLFTIQLEGSSADEYYTTSLVFHCASVGRAKALWKCAVQCHAFYRVNASSTNGSTSASSSKAPVITRTGLYNRVSMRVQSLLHKKKRRRVFDVVNTQDPENEGGARIAWNKEEEKVNDGDQKSEQNGSRHNWTVIEDEIAYVDDDVDNFLSGAKRPQTEPDELIMLEADSDGRFGFIVSGGSDWSTPVTVSRVAPNSSSSKQRLEQGHIILEINGNETKNMTHDEVVAAIREAAIADRSILLRVRHRNYVSPTDSKSDREEPQVQYTPEWATNGYCGGATGGSNATRVPIKSPLEISMRLLEEMTEAQLTSAFLALPRENEQETCSVATHPANEMKNRYRDVLPYDSNRVVLLNPEGGKNSDSSFNDYINASHIQVPISGSGIVNGYIAAQGPLPSTTADFWRLIWDSGTPVVIMLTPLHEQGRPKCHQYWPQGSLPQKYGSMSISLKNTESTKAYTLRHIRISRGTESRSILQAQYTAWPDHGVPVCENGFIEFMERAREWRAGFVEPLLVHCSAGIGRTGLFILVETAMCLIEAGMGVNVFEILRDMRRQRAHLVQTSSQFVFAVRVILRMFRTRRVQPIHNGSSTVSSNGPLPLNSCGP